MNRQQIETLKVGDVVQFQINGVQWKPAEVVEISFRGVNVRGKAFVGFYTKFGEDARISGSVAEGENFYRLVSVA